MDEAKNAFTTFINQNSASIIAMVVASAGLSLTIKWIRRVFR